MPHREYIQSGYGDCTVMYFKQEIDLSVTVLPHKSEKPVGKIFYPRVPSVDKIATY